jgi:hypothetical protein
MKLFLKAGLGDKTPTEGALLLTSLSKVLAKTRKKMGQRQNSSWSLVGNCTQKSLSQGERNLMFPLLKHVSSLTNLSEASSLPMGICLSPCIPGEDFKQRSEKDLVTA